MRMQDFIVVRHNRTADQGACDRVVLGIFEGRSRAEVRHAVRQYHTIEHGDSLEVVPVRQAALDDCDAAQKMGDRSGVTVQ